MITKAVRKKEVIRKWYCFDAEGQTLGRLAVVVTKLLLGKDKTNLVNYLDSGDMVVVYNLEKIKVTGGKEKKKVYFSYSGYPGGLKRETYEKLFARRPLEVFRKAVFGMLPDNKLRAGRLDRLHLYADADFPRKVKFVNLEVKND